MRNVMNIPHSRFKITVFIWNEKYLIEIEADPFKQTYKLPLSAVGSEEELKKIISEDFLQSCEKTFEQMYEAFKKEVEKLS